MARLYLDNAATSFPKPPAVLKAMEAYARDLGASAGRGAYREAVETGEMLADCRRRLARLIHAEFAECVVFTLNCSAALNQAIKGILQPGDHVVTTMMEHNSVLRPLHALAEEAAIEATYVPADPATGIVDPAEVLRAIRPETRLIAAIHASNVTGSLQAIERIGPEARRRGIAFMVDAAQTAGHVPIDVQVAQIGLLAMPGHKGLLGPLGTGALYIRPGLEMTLRPLVQGGTGSASELPIQPGFMPDRFETGSHNAIGIAGLGAGLAWIEARGVPALRRHEIEICGAFAEEARGIEGLRVYGPADAGQRVGVFSLRLEGYTPFELSALLERDFGVLSRPGLHCAPFAHQMIGTRDSDGTTRLSFGAFNTLEEVQRCVRALRSLATAAAPA